MGGRGSASNIAKNNITQFPKQNQDYKNSNKWDYRGYKDAVDNIENAVKSSRSRNRDYEIASAINSQEKLIQQEIDRNKSGTGDMGNENVLLTQRRRLRQLKEKLRKRN